MAAKRYEMFAGELLKRLRVAARSDLGAAHAGLVADVIRFLDKRLTDAAKAGCHHCGEGERGTPCWWCGLKN